MWGYPWLTWLSIVAIIGSMAFVDSVRSQLVPSLPAIILAIVIGVVRDRRHAARSTATATAARPARTTADSLLRT